MKADDQTDECLLKNLNYRLYFVIFIFYFMVYWLKKFSNILLLSCFRFIHDLVDEVYFRKKPETVFNNILHLMEHVVFIFGLWEEEEGLKQIYEFLNKFSGAHWHYILDSWKMQLFRLHMKTVKIEFENSCQEIRRSQRIRIPARKFLTWMQYI